MRAEIHRAVSSIQGRFNRTTPRESPGSSAQTAGVLDAIYEVHMDYIPGTRLQLARIGDKGCSRIAIAEALPPVELTYQRRTRVRPGERMPCPVNSTVCHL